MESQRLLKLISFESELWKEGKKHIAGLDEAGRGPLAGPVVAAAVIFPAGNVNITGLNDSKKLSALQRERLEIEIKAKALCFAVSSASHLEIDRYNILQATKLAMVRAINKLSLRPEHLLIDAITLQGVELPQLAIVKGDSLSASIAAASILAKCYRDRLMISFDKIFPQYGFAKHKGYPTVIHYTALKSFGPCPIHRRSFRLL